MLLILLGGMSLSNSVQAAIAYVQQNASASSNSGSPQNTKVLSLTNAPTVGNTVFVLMATDFVAPSGQPPECTDDAANSYVADISLLSSNTYALICSAQIASVPTTITIDHKHTAYNQVVQVHEFSGLLAAPAIDQAAGAGGTSTTPSSGATATTSQADELIIGVVSVAGPSSEGFTGDAAFTGGPFRLSQDAGSARTLNVQYRIVSATGTYSYAPTLGVSTTWSDVVATYKGTAAGSYAVSGTVFTDEGTTNIGAGKTVRLLVNGTSVGTAVTDASGNYSINTSATSGDNLLLYLDGDDGTTTDATTVTVATGVGLSNIDLYVDHVITRHDNASALTNALMDTAKGAYSDSEILYSVAAGNLTVSGSATELYLPPGHSYAPGGEITSPNIESLGNFNGGSDNITVSDLLAISGGSFTSTSGTLAIGKTAGAGTVTVLSQTAGTFNHNNGTMKFVTTEAPCSTPTALIDVATSINFFNAEVAASYSCNNARVEVAAGDTVNVLNDLIHSSGAMLGAWEVKGNLIVGASANGGAGTITMNGNSAQTYTHTGGRTAYLNVDTTGTVAPAPGVTTFGAGQLVVSAGSFTAPSGNLTLGNLSTNATYTVLDTSGGGSFLHNNSQLLISTYGSGCSSPDFTIDANSSLSLHGLEVSATGACPSQRDVITAAGDTVIVQGGLTHTAGVLKGTWQVQGDVTIAATALGGTATLEFTGNNTQIYTDNGGNEPDGNYTINKTGGVVQLASALELTAAGQNLTITQGTLDLAGFNLNVNNVLTVDTSGVLQLEGDETISTTTTTLNTGSTVVYDGAGTYASLLLGNNYHHLTFNGSGSWTLNAPLDVNGDFNLLTGSVDTAGNDLTVAGFWNTNGSFSHGSATVTLDGINQTISGNNTFHNLSKTETTADTLYFVANGTQIIDNILTLSGAVGQPLSLRSTSPGTQWNLIVATSTVVGYVDVQDSNAAGGITINPNNSADSGNNNNWFFSGGLLQLEKQVWDETGANCLASSPPHVDCGNTVNTIIPSGSLINFLIFVRNPLGVTASDIRFKDQLDDSGFSYVSDSLWITPAGSEPADNATPQLIYNATLLANAGENETDAVDGDKASAVTSSSPNVITVGANGGTQSQLDIPANKTFALRFQAIKD